MTNLPESSPPSLPFVIGDVVLIGFAAAVVAMSGKPLAVSHWFIVLAALVAGAFLSCWPYVLRHRAASRLTEADSVSNAVAALRELEPLARRVEETTARWQEAQDAADRTTAAARDIAAGMAAEQEKFAASIQQGHETERRLVAVELDKLRRSQQESIEVVIALLDNVMALHGAAVRSGQQKVIEQLTRFRGVSMELVRRLGLVALIPAPGEAFDPERHVLAEGQPTGETGASIDGVLAAGFTHQGVLLRKPLVALKKRCSPPAGFSPGTTGATLIHPSPFEHEFSWANEV
jgi:molecular chaperone GrpE (heat shock protein)